MTTAVAKSRRMLVAIVAAHHRGPDDTWTAARDRAAKTIGIDRAYAARIWSRWQDMKDVSGEALMRLCAAYVAHCEKSEAREAVLIAEAERIDRDTADEIMAATALARRVECVATTAARADAQTPRPLR